MIAKNDKVEVGGVNGRRAKGWNVSQSSYLGKQGTVVNIRHIKGKPDAFDVKFEDGRTLEFEEAHLKYIETSLANLSL